MHILVRGTDSKRLKNEIKDAIQFYARILLKKAARDKLKIIVQIDTNKKRRYLDCYGLCDPIGKNKNTGLNEFEIYAVHQPRRLPDSNVFKTIAHEMVHLKQYTTGQLGAYLVPTKSPTGKSFTNTRWNGKLYKTREDDSDDDEYYDSPWEIEAYGREVGLYRRWRKANGKEEK